MFSDTIFPQKIHVLSGWPCVTAIINAKTFIYNFYLRSEKQTQTGSRIYVLWNKTFPEGNNDWRKLLAWGKASSVQSSQSVIGFQVNLLLWSVFVNSYSAYSLYAFSVFFSWQRVFAMHFSYQLGRKTQLWVLW